MDREGLSVSATGGIVIREGAKLCAGSGGAACGAAAVVVVGGVSIYVGGEIYDACKLPILDGLDRIFAEGAPDLPDDLVGEQDDKSGKTSGKRHVSGPLSPEHGGTGDAESDFGELGGTEGVIDIPRAGPGAKIAPNGIIYRPGNDKKGPRIDIPANGTKPPETLHYPTTG